MEETVAATENTEAREQEKSDVDSDCGQDSLTPLSPNLAVRPQNSSNLDEAETRQKRSVDDLAGSKLVSGSTESTKQRQGRGGSRSRSKESSPAQGCPKGANRKRKRQQNISKRNRVNGLIVQNQRARGMKEVQKLRHVNEA